MTTVISVTEYVVLCLPFIRVLAILGILASAIVYLFRARSVRTWLKLCMRISGGILILPLFVCVLLLLAMVACSSRPRILVSPDSQHVAEYSYEAGFLGRDYTFVSVRRNWSLIRSDVYRYAGPSDWSGTEVRWIDNEHLLIRYTQDGRDHFQQCGREAAGILVQCVADPAK